jgi:hypothetical protein
MQGSIASSSSTGRTCSLRGRPSRCGGLSRTPQLSVQARAARYDRRKPPPPDLPSLLFDQRIVYLGMPVGLSRPQPLRERVDPAQPVPRPARALDRCIAAISSPWCLPAKDWRAVEAREGARRPQFTISSLLPPPSLQLVPAVTELMVAELLYLEKQGNSLPIEMLINSSGTTRQDGEIVSALALANGSTGSIRGNCSPQTRAWGPVRAPPVWRSLPTNSLPPMHLMLAAVL